MNDIPKCSAPFSQLTLDSQGNVYPCCYHFGYRLGNINRDSITSIWHGPKLKKLRQEFLTNQIKTCRGRMKNLSCHQSFQHLPSVQANSPVRIDIRLNGTCNLKCIMCDVWKNPEGVFDQGNFWEDSQENLFPYLAEIEVIGGEPFIQEDTFRLIREVSKVNSNCLWSFVTNASYKFSKRIKSTLEGINLGKIHISLDSLDPSTYAKIRRGGNLKTTLHCLDQWLKFRDERRKMGFEFPMVLSSCILQHNWQEIPTFIQFCQTKGCIPQLQYAYKDPSGSSLEFLGHHEREIVSQSIRKSIKQDDIRFVRPILAALEPKQTPQPT